jgi:hypothetical protein
MRILEGLAETLVWIGVLALFVGPIGGKFRH